jgi:hypothetical protein
MDIEEINKLFRKVSKLDVGIGVENVRSNVKGSGLSVKILPIEKTVDKDMSNKLNEIFERPTLPPLTIAARQD